MLQANRQLSPRTVEAYGRALEDLLCFCSRNEPQIVVETATRAHLAAYVNALATRPGKRGANVIKIESGTGLSHQTISLRVTAARLYYDHLVEQGVRATNPVGRGKYTRRSADLAGYRHSGTSSRPLLRRKPPKLPWIPDDAEFLHLLHALRLESVRNQAMLMLMYDGALRRDELVKVELSDVDWALREVTLRPEICKNGSGRLVLFTKITALSLKMYLHSRERLRLPLLFLSESNRNRSASISCDMVNKIVKNVADRANLPRLHPHTFRHLRLTHMARCGVPEQIIAQYAGHRSIETTRIYVHLSGREISATVAKKMDDFNRWVEQALAEKAT
jgi:integrase/recombinase XerD